MTKLQVDRDSGYRRAAALLPATLAASVLGGVVGAGGGVQALR
jgi:hypothetical protein